MATHHTTVVTADASAADSLIVERDGEQVYLGAYGYRTPPFPVDETIAWLDAWRRDSPGEVHVLVLGDDDRRDVLAIDEAEAEDGVAGLLGVISIDTYGVDDAVYEDLCITITRTMATTIIDALR